MGPLIRSSSVTGGGTLTASGGVLTAASPGTDDKAWAYVNVYAPRGTLIEITCEAKQGTATSQGRISVDQHPDDDSVGGNNVDYVQMEDTNWRPYKLVVPGSHLNPFSSVTFGVWNIGIGSAQFRNIKVTVYNASDFSPEYRACMLKKTGTGTWTFDDAPGRFVNIGCHTIELDDAYILVRWDKMQTWQRPIVNVQMDQWNNRGALHVQVSGGEKDFVRVYIFDTRTGAAINPKTGISGDMYIGLQAIGL